MQKSFLLVCSLSALGTVVLDQYVKSLYSATQSILNPGVSFGFLSGPFLTFLLLAVLLAVSRYLLTHHAPAIPTGLLIGGASSNLLDRFFLGGVKDIFAVPVLNVYNNLADWAIVIAVVWLFIWQSRTPHHYDSDRL
ncbi:signal peptidase II [Candidatus Woesebacteria bacterium]|nr:signal peptidase II [Candidatus Woesebacteria bacterium]